MQPSPIADTSSPPFPSLRFSMVLLLSLPNFLPCHVRGRVHGPCSGRPGSVPSPGPGSDLGLEADPCPDADLEPGREVGAGAGIPSAPCPAAAARLGLGRAALPPRSCVADRATAAPGLPALAAPSSLPAGAVASDPGARPRDSLDAAPAGARVGGRCALDACGHRNDVARPPDAGSSRGRVPYCLAARI